MKEPRGNITMDVRRKKQGTTWILDLPLISRWLTLSTQTSNRGHNNEHKKSNKWTRLIRTWWNIDSNTRFLRCFCSRCHDDDHLHSNNKTISFCGSFALLWFFLSLFISNVGHASRDDFRCRVDDMMNCTHERPIKNDSFSWNRFLLHRGRITFRDTDQHFGYSQLSECVALGWWFPLSEFASHKIDQPPMPSVPCQLTFFCLCFCTISTLI